MERESKSDKGVVSLIKDTLQDAFGVSGETAERIMKIIREKGEMANVKKHVRGLSGMTHKRLNSALDYARKDLESKAEAKDEEPKKEEKPRKEEKKDKKEVKEGKLTFMQHMLNELQDGPSVTMDVKPEDIRDPEKRQAAIKAQRNQARGKSAQIRAINDKIKELQARKKELMQGGNAQGEM